MTNPEEARVLDQAPSFIDRFRSDWLAEAAIVGGASLAFAGGAAAPSFINVDHAAAAAMSAPKVEREVPVTEQAFPYNVVSNEAVMDGANAVVSATIANERATVMHSKSPLRLQTLLNKIHQTLPSGDSVAGSPGCFLKDLNLPCHRYYVEPTSAFMTSSTGGFTTNCKNKNVSTYHHYKVTPRGQTYRTCGPFWPQDHKSKPGQFQGKLNHIGSMIRSSVGVNTQERTQRVGGTRKKVTATYECPTPSGDSTAPSEATTENVQEINLRRNHSASVEMC